MNKQRIIRLRILHQPLHRAHDIRLRRHAHGIFLVVRQNNHVLPPIAEFLVQEVRHVRDIIDAAAQGVRLSEIVDADEQRFPTTRAGGVLEAVIRRGAAAKVLRLLRRTRGHVVLVP